MLHWTHVHGSSGTSQDVKKLGHATRVLNKHGNEICWTFTVLASGCPVTWNFSSPLLTRASLIAQLVKNPPAVQETPVRSLGWEDSPGEGIGYPLQYSRASVVAQLLKNLHAGDGFDPWVGKIPWRGEWLRTPVFWPGELHGLSMWQQRVGHDWTTNRTHFFHIQGANNKLLIKTCNV